MNCIACGSKEYQRKFIRDLDHGGVEAAWNVIYFCVKHMREANRTSMLFMARNHYLVGLYLKNRGWVLKDGKLSNDKVQLN